MIGGSEAETELLLLFKRHEQVSSVVLKSLAKFPGSADIFGGIVDGRIIVPSNGRDVYEYNLSTDEWAHTERGYHSRHFCSATVNQKPLSFAVKTSSAELLDLKYLPDFGHSTRHFSSETICPTELPIKRVTRQSVTHIGNGKVVVVGGHNSYNSVTYELKCSNRVFQGKVQAGRNDFTWKELPNMKKGRCAHVAFKMKDSFYVVGGGNCQRMLSCCERFSFKQNKWNDCKHSLPYHLSCASVVVSNDESFAVITGGRSRNGCCGGIIIFTEQDGFQLMSSQLLNERCHHLSIML